MMSGQFPELKIPIEMSGLTLDIGTITAKFGYLTRTGAGWGGGDEKVTGDTQGKKNQKQKRISNKRSPQSKNRKNKNSNKNKRYNVRKNIPLVSKQA